MKVPHFFRHPQLATPCLASRNVRRRKNMNSDRHIRIIILLVCAIRQGNLLPLSKEVVHICNNNVCVAGKVDGPDGKCTCCIDCATYLHREKGIDCPLTPLDCTNCIKGYKEQAILNGGTMNECIKIRNNTKVTQIEHEKPTESIVNATESFVSSNTKSASISPGLIAAIVVPILVVVVAIAVFYCLRCRKVSFGRRIP